LTQSLEPESFAVGRSFTTWECPAPLQSDSNSRSCANLASRTAVSRIITGQRENGVKRVSEALAEISYEFNISLLQRELNSRFPGLDLPSVVNPKIWSDAVIDFLHFNIQVPEYSYPYDAKNVAPAVESGKMLREFIASTKSNKTDVTRKYC